MVLGFGAKMIATIAIIHEDDAVRDSARALLECNDYAVREHPSAEDFLSRPRDDVDCVVLDHHLRGMNGIDLVERLRAEGDLIPALLLTADLSIGSRAARLGAELLPKPVPAEHLVLAIEKTRKAKPRR
jgi:two-component system response regulator FixJ